MNAPTPSRPVRRPLWQRSLGFAWRQSRRALIIALGLALGWGLRQLTAARPAKIHSASSSVAATSENAPLSAREALRTGRYRSPAEMEREIIADIDAGRVTDYARLARELLASPYRRMRWLPLMCCVARWGEADPEAALDFCRKNAGKSTLHLFRLENLRQDTWDSASVVDHSITHDSLVTAAESIMARLADRDEARALRFLDGVGLAEWNEFVGLCRVVDRVKKPYLSTDDQEFLARVKLSRSVRDFSSNVSEGALLLAANRCPDSAKWLIRTALARLVVDDRLPPEVALAHLAAKWPRKILDATFGPDFTGAPSSLPSAGFEHLLWADRRIAVELANQYPEVEARLNYALGYELAYARNAFSHGTAEKVREISNRFRMSNLEVALGIDAQASRMHAVRDLVPDQPLGARLAGTSSQPEQMGVFEILRTPAAEAEPAFQAFAQLPAETQARWRLDMAASFSKDTPALAASVLAAATPDELSRPETAWVLSRVASRFVETDSVAASAWIGSLPAGPARDAGVLAMLRATAAENPETAAQWAATLQSDDARAQASALLQSNQNATR